MIKGSVVAAKRITEQEYRGKSDFTHAEPGDEGQVIEIVDEQWVMVRWQRNDSVAQCHNEELRRVE